MKKYYDPDKRRLAAYIEQLQVEYDAEGQSRSFTFSVTGDFCDGGFIYLCDKIEDSYTGLEDVPDKYRILGGKDDESTHSTTEAEQ